MKARAYSAEIGYRFLTTPFAPRIGALLNLTLRY